MRILRGIFALFVTVAAAVPLAAEETPPSVGRDAVAPEKSRAEQLDDLFATLQAASTSDEAAKTAESEILHLWLRSGSDTVDVLMLWAMRAMDAKMYADALDLLDRIVTMKPDYVEGWNKRATVYYLTDDYSKSLADIERTLAIEPRHFGALSGLGMIMRDIGDDKRAAEAFRRALAVDPHLDNVKKSLDELETKASGSPI
ncbi:MAG TPA: tetratricopeptide repeat protein [Bauldia sp.]|nr:tetratricopeptide repeat protein [Bauldia sp.]